MNVLVDIMKLYQQVTVLIDILFVNIIPFLVFIRLNLNLGYVERLKICRVPTLVKAEQRTKKTYSL